MATNTYVALDKVTVGTATTTVTFTGISQSYTDLRIVINGGIDTADNNTFLRVGNGSIDSGSNYSDTFIDSRGTSTPGSSRHTNATRIQLDYYGSISTTNSTLTVDLMNYSNTTTYKTLLSRFGNTTSTSYSGTGVLAGLWRSTNAINTIQFSLDSTAKFNAGTTFSLYGIKAWANIEATPKATGGYVYSDSTYWYHAFPFSSTFTPNQSLTADILVIAGGGGGGGFTGGNGNGGGGAGGLLAYSSQSLIATGYTCTIGAGGAGGLTASGSTNGVNSQFGALTASVGGGRGANGGSAPNGSSTGGSGGGGQGSNDLTYVNGSAGTSGQGFAGANGYNAGSFAGGGGGGGAGGAGQIAVADAIGGVGGVGATSSLINAIGSTTGYGQLVSGNYYFAGGGGGSTSSNSTSGIALGGNGGGGTGYYDGGPAGGAGISGLGGGGGAGRAANGGKGGSGIVVIRYAK